MANIINTLSTVNLSAQIKPNIASAVTIINPFSVTPLTAMLFKMNLLNEAQSAVKGTKAPSELTTVEKVYGQTFEDFEMTRVGTTTTGTANGTAVGSATTSNNTLEVANAYIFKAGDIVKIYHPTTGALREVDRVSSVNYTTGYLTLTRGVSTAASAAIATGDKVTKVTWAGGEGSANPDFITPEKSKRTNYTQNFKAAWKITDQMKKTQTWTEDEVTLLKKNSIFTMWEDMESAFYFGIPKFQAYTDDDGNKVTTTGGVLDGVRNGGGYVETASSSGATVVKSDIDAMLKYSFSNFGQSNKGKVMLCSADAIEDIDAIVATSGNGYVINLNAGDSITQGYAVKMWKTSFTPEGGIPILHAPLFERQGFKGIILLDLDTVKVKEFMPFEYKPYLQVNGEQKTGESIVSEYGLGRVGFQKNGYLRLAGSSEPVS